MAGSTAFAEAYWMFRERLEYGYAFESALRDFYDEHGIAPHGAPIAGAPIPGAGPDLVPIQGTGVFPVMGAVAAAVAEPFAPPVRSSKAARPSGGSPATLRLRL